MSFEAAHAAVPARLTAPDSRLPASLRDLSHPPASLWYLGDPSVLQAADRMVAIVGTRESSAYGERIATRLAAGCARAGLVVVSGLARGIDAAAHRAAMSAEGRTVAVLGTGVDVPYPAGHRALHAAIQRQGAVLSEMEPGTTAFPGCFPRRNRIIAALAKVTVVVEAGFKSGAINTATQALDLGRVVAAVPGQIDDPRAAGTNALIRDGAHVITDVDDLLMIYDLSTTSVSFVDSTPVGSEIEGAAEILRAIDGGCRTPDLLAADPRFAGRPVPDLLLRLELAGEVTRGADGYRLAGGRGAG